MRNNSVQRTNVRNDSMSRSSRVKYKTIAVNQLSKSDGVDVVWTIQADVEITDYVDWFLVGGDLIEQRSQLIEKTLLDGGGTRPVEHNDGGSELSSDSTNAH